MRSYRVYQVTLDYIKKYIEREAKRLSSEKRFSEFSWLPQQIDFKLLQELVDKEIPRYVDYEYDGYADGCPVPIYDIAYCPECGRCFETDCKEHYNYCPDCGQRLDWEFSELEGEEE